MGQGSESIGNDDGYDSEDYEFDALMYGWGKYSNNKLNVKVANKVVTKKVVAQKAKLVVRGKTVIKKCSNCACEHTVRQADLNRGWGKFCSKSCKAKFNYKG